MFNFIRQNFNEVRSENMRLLKRNIPMWVSIVYYIIGGIIVLPLVPLVIICVVIIQRWRVKRYLRALEDSVADEIRSM